MNTQNKMTMIAWTAMLTLGLNVLGLNVLGLNVVVAQDSDQISSFRSHVKSVPSLNDKARAEIDEIIEEYAEDSVSDAVTESLIVMHRGYADAIEASDGDDVDAAVSVLMPLAESADKFLAADASFYLARMLMNNEQFESAMPLLKKLDSELGAYTTHAGKVQFYIAVAQAGLLQYTQAIATFNEFLELYPMAPERLRVAAWRQIQQLREIEEGQMADIYQRMDYSRRKLSLIDPGDSTQQQQSKIVGMLGKLIKQQEKKEASNNQKQNKDQKQPNTKKQQQQKPQQQQSQSQQSSKSQQGGTSSQANGKAVNKSYSDAPTSPWSRLRDRSRDPANNAIKDKLPARYRDIVERYYEAANGERETSKSFSK